MSEKITGMSCIIHDWIEWKQEPFFLNGEAIRFPLKTAIRLTEENPTHTMSELSSMRAWERRGFNFVRVAFNFYVCSLCRKKKKTEVYINPVYLDDNNIRRPATKKEETATQ